MTSNLLWNSTNHWFQSGRWLVESGVLLQWSFHRPLYGWSLSPLRKTFSLRNCKAILCREDCIKVCTFLLLCHCVSWLETFSHFDKWSFYLLSNNSHASAEIVLIVCPEWLPNSNSHYVITHTQKTHTPERFDWPVFIFSVLQWTAFIRQKHYHKAYRMKAQRHNTHFSVP